MLNMQQKELSENLFSTLKAQYPEIDLMEIIESPFEQGSVWMRVYPPADLQKKRLFGELAAELSTDILVEYGCDIIITYVAGSSVVH
jgi:hypothetical protein